MPTRLLLILLLVVGCRAASPAVVPPEDAGEPDAGAPEDAGLPEDAGAPPDGGAVTVDAGPPDAGEADAGVDAGTIVDNDHDGLDDDLEMRLATEYLPFLSFDPNDGCTTGGIVFRAMPHPQAPVLVFILYDHLYNDDCGLGGHAGDDEAFGVTVDPSVPAPRGITALVAISHQNTACQVVTKCGSCGTLDACETGAISGQEYPVVYSSKGKHGGYLKKSGAGSCSTTLCLDSCTLATSTLPVPLVNAGEPNAHLIENLTTQGFITSANGWTHQELFNVNPWETTKDFGTAGNIAGDLTDMSFLPAACLAP